MDALENLIGGSDVPLNASDSDLDGSFPPLMVTTGAPMSTPSQPQTEAAIPPGGFTHFLQTSPPLDAATAVVAASSASTGNVDDANRPATATMKFESRMPHQQTKTTNAIYTTTTTQIDVNSQFAQQQSVTTHPQLNQGNVVLMPGVPVYVCRPGEVLDDNQLKKIMEESTLRYGLGKLYKVDEKYCFVPDQPQSTFTSAHGSSIQMFSAPAADQQLQLQQTHIQTFPAAQHCTHGATYHILPQQTQTSNVQSHTLSHQDQTGRHHHHHHPQQHVQQQQIQVQQPHHHATTQQTTPLQTQQITRTPKTVTVQQAQPNGTASTVTSNNQQSTVIQPSIMSQPTTQAPQTVQIQMQPQATTGSSVPVSQQVLQIPHFVNQNGQMILQLPPNMTQNGVLAPVNLLCPPTVVGGVGNNGSTTTVAASAASKPVRQAVKTPVTASSKKPKKILPKPSINRPLSIAPAPTSHTPLAPAPVATATFAQIKPSGEQGQTMTVPPVQQGVQTLTQVGPAAVTCSVKGGRKLGNNRKNNRRGPPHPTPTVVAVSQPVVAAPAVTSSNALTTVTGSTGAAVTSHAGQVTQGMCCHHQLQHQHHQPQQQQTTQRFQHQAHSVSHQVQHQHHVHHVHQHAVHGNMQQQNIITTTTNNAQGGQQCVCSPATVYPLNAAVPVDQAQWQAASSHQHCVVPNSAVIHQPVHSCPHHHIHGNQHIVAHHGAQLLTQTQLPQPGEIHQPQQQQQPQQPQQQQQTQQDQNNQHQAEAALQVQEHAEEQNNDGGGNQERDYLYEAVLAAFGDAGVPEVHSILDTTADEILEGAHNVEPDNFFVAASSEASNQLPSTAAEVLMRDGSTHNNDAISRAETLPTDFNFQMDNQTQQQERQQQQPQAQQQQQQQPPPPTEQPEKSQELTSIQDQQQSISQQALEFHAEDAADLMDVMSVAATIDADGSKEADRTEVEDSMTDNELGMLLDDTHPAEIHESSQSEVCSILETDSTNQQTSVLTPSQQASVPADHPRAKLSAPQVDDTSMERMGGIPKKSPAKRRINRRSGRDSKENSSFGPDSESSVILEAAENTSANSKRPDSNDFDFLTALTVDFPQNQTGVNMGNLDNDSFADVFGEAVSDEKELEAVSEMLERGSMEQSQQAPIENEKKDSETLDSRLKEMNIAQESENTAPEISDNPVTELTSKPPATVSVDNYNEFAVGRLQPTKPDNVEDVTTVDERSIEDDNQPMFEASEMDALAKETALAIIGKPLKDNEMPVADKQPEPTSAPVDRDEAPLSVPERSTSPEYPQETCDQEDELPSSKVAQTFGLESGLEKKSDHMKSPSLDIIDCATSGAMYQEDPTVILDHSIRCEDNNDTSTESLETSTGGDSSNRNNSEDKFGIDSFVNQDFTAPCENVRALIEDSSALMGKPYVAEPSVANVGDEIEEELEPPELQCEGVFAAPEDPSALGCTEAPTNSSPRMDMMPLDKLESMIQAAKVSIGLSSTDDSGNRSQLETSDTSLMYGERVESSFAESEKSGESGKAVNTFGYGISSDGDSVLRQHYSDEMTVVGGAGASVGEEKGCLSLLGVPDKADDLSTVERESSRLDLDGRIVMEDNTQPPALSPNLKDEDSNKGLEGNFHLYSQASRAQFSFTNFMSPRMDGTPSSSGDDTTSEDSFVVALRRPPSNFEAKNWHDHHGRSMSAEVEGLLIRRVEKCADEIATTEPPIRVDVYSDDDFEQESPTLVKESEVGHTRRMSGDSRLSPPNLEHHDEAESLTQVDNTVLVDSESQSIAIVNSPVVEEKDVIVTKFVKSPVEGSLVVNMNKCTWEFFEKEPCEEIHETRRPKKGRGRKRRKVSTNRSKANSSKCNNEKVDEAFEVAMAYINSKDNTPEPMIDVQPPLVELPVCLKAGKLTEDLVEPPVTIENDTFSNDNGLLNEYHSDPAPCDQPPITESLLVAAAHTEATWAATTYELEPPVKEKLPVKISKKGKSRKRRGSSSSRLAINRVKRSRPGKMLESSNVTVNPVNSSLSAPDTSSIEEPPSVEIPEIVTIDQEPAVDVRINRVSATDLNSSERLPTHSYQLPEKEDPSRMRRSHSTADQVQDADLATTDERPLSRFETSNGRLLLKINLKGVPAVPPVANLVEDSDAIGTPPSEEETTTELLTNCRDQTFVDRKVSPIRLSRRRVGAQMESGDNPGIPIFHVVGRNDSSSNVATEEEVPNPMEVLPPIAEAMETIYGTTTIYGQPEHDDLRESDRGSPGYLESEEPEIFAPTANNQQRATSKPSPTPTHPTEQPPVASSGSTVSGRTSLPRAAKTTCKSNLSLESYLTASVPTPSDPMSDSAAEVVFMHQNMNDDIQEPTPTKPVQLQETMTASEPASLAKRGAKSKIPDSVSKVAAMKQLPEPPPVRQRRFFKSAKEDRRSSKRNSSYVASQLFFKHAMNSHHSKIANNSGASANAAGAKASGLAGKTEGVGAAVKIKRKRGRPAKKSIVAPAKPASSPATPPAAPQTTLEAGLAAQVNENFSQDQQQQQLYHQTRLHNSITSPAAGGLIPSLLSPDAVVTNANSVPAPRPSGTPRSNPSATPELVVEHRTVLVLKRTGNEYSIKARENEAEEEEEAAEEENRHQAVVVEPTMLTAEACQPMMSDGYDSTIQKVKTSAYKKSKEDKKREKKERKRNRKLKKQQRKMNSNNSSGARQSGIRMTAMDVELAVVNPDLVSAVTGDGASEKSSVSSGAVVNHNGTVAADEEDCLFPAEEVTKLRQNFGSHPTSVPLGHQSGSSCASHSSSHQPGPDEANGGLYMLHAGVSPDEAQTPVGAGHADLDDVGPPLLTPATLTAPAVAAASSSNSVVSFATPSLDNGGQAVCGASGGNACGGSSETSSSPGNSFSEPAIQNTTGGSRPGSGHHHHHHQQQQQSQQQTQQQQQSASQSQQQQQSQASGGADGGANSHQESSSPPKKRRYVTGGESNLTEGHNNPLLSGATGADLWSRRTSPPPPPPPPPSYKDDEKIGQSGGSSRSGPPNSSSSTSVSSQQQHHSTPNCSSAVSSASPSNRYSSLSSSSRSTASTTPVTTSAPDSSGSVSAAAVVNSHYYSLNPYSESQYHPAALFDSPYFAYSAIMNARLSYNPYDFLSQSRPPASGHHPFTHTSSHTHHPHHPPPPSGFSATSSRPGAAHEAAVAAAAALYQDPPAAHSGSNGVVAAAVSSNLYAPHSGSAAGQVGHAPAAYHPMFHSGQGSGAPPGSRYRQFGHPGGGAAGGGGSGSGGPNSQFGAAGASASSHFPF